MKPFRAARRNREAMAMRADVDILSLMADAPPPNEIRGEVGILHIRGPIESHRIPADLCESYERIREAFHELNDDESVKVIMMLIDSPGGLVAQLNATVRALRKAKTKPVYAIADEMATSAAYALSCIADEIIATPSAVVGSVGVISTMCSQARADQKQGLDFVTITSGERKADGHPHMPIEDGAVRAEEERVDELAAQFYALAGESRDLSPEYLRALEAGIFLGAEALEMGLVDDVADVDEAIEAIISAHGLVAQLDTSSAPDSAETFPEASMLTAKAKIAALTRKMATSTSKKERSSLSSQITKLLAALPSAATTKKSYRLEEEKTETSDEDEEEEGGNETDREEESDDDEKKEASHSEEEESAESEDDEKKAEFPDKDKDEDKDEKKKESTAARGELAALRAEVTSLRSVVAGVQRREARATHEGVIAEALRTKRISPAEAKSLAKEDGAYVKAFLAARPKSIVLTPEEALRPLPKGSAKVAAESGGSAEAAGVDLTPEMQAMLDGIADPKVREQVLVNWKAQVNGVAR